MKKAAVEGEEPIAPWRHQPGLGALLPVSLLRVRELLSGDQRGSPSMFPTEEQHAAENRVDKALSHSRPSLVEVKVELMTVSREASMRPPLHGYGGAELRPALLQHWPEGAHRLLDGIGRRLAHKVEIRVVGSRRVPVPVVPPETIFGVAP